VPADGIIDAARVYHQRRHLHQNGPAGAFFVARITDSLNIPRASQRA